MDKFCIPMQPQPFLPVAGQTYRLRAGGDYRCTGYTDDGDPVLQNTMTLWTLVAHDVVRYPSGLIEWGYSTGGHWDAPESYTWIPKKQKTEGES